MEPELPFEFFVQGTPISLGGSSRSKRLWKQKVADEARKSLPENHFTISDPLKFEILLLLEDDLQGDIDNIVKPIQDALVNVVFADDRQIEDLHVAKLFPGRGAPLTSPSGVLLDAIGAGLPVVYIKVYR